MEELILADYHSNPIITEQQKTSLDSSPIPRFAAHNQATDVSAHVHEVTWAVTEPEQARIMMVKDDHRRWWQYTWERRSLLRGIGLLSTINTVSFLGGACSVS
jgi:hypothetical protein